MARRITKRDFDTVASYIVDEYNGRKKRRADLEKMWDEMDRQCRQQAIQFNVDPRTGRPIEGKEWQPYYELPWQILTLELIVDDVMRLLFPVPGKYYDLRPDVEIETLDQIKEGLREELSIGLINDFSVGQDELSNIIEGLLNYGHTQYDFVGQWCKLITDAIKYGTMAGRVRTVTREQFDGDYRNTTRTLKQFPAIVHYPIRNVYLDDSMPSILHSNIEVGPAHIFTSAIKAGSLQKLLSRGEDGWIKSAASDFKDTKADTDITLIEMEGDFLIPREGEPIFLPNCICTVAQTGGVGNKLVRYQTTGDFRSWFTETYFSDNSQCEGKPTPYGTSPLLMGSPIQAGGVTAFNRALQAAIYNAEPAVQYDKDDPGFAASGPRIHPGATIPSVGDIKPLPIGNVADLMMAYTALKTDFGEVSGVTAPRTGQQTKSHQTAFAVDQELTRSVLRTVEFVQRMKRSAMLTATHLEYKHWRELISNDEDAQRVYVHEYRTFIPVTPSMLPEAVYIEVLGVGQPQEEFMEAQKRLQAIELATKIDTGLVQLGGKPANWEELRNFILRDAFGDIERFVQPAGANPTQLPIPAPTATAVPVPAQPDEGVAPSVDPSLAALGVGR